jgi:F-type H+-transporting ATPase subunit epsilon
MLLKLITPEKILFSADITMVVIPGTEGDFGVLPGHAPFISTIRPGIITIDTADGTHRKVSVIGGIAEVVPDHCVILAENAEDCSAITLVDAQNRLQAAKTALVDAVSEQAQSDAEKKLALAEALVLAA